ncbi:MAG: proline racemase family protein [Deltaproteobacteria bacterium]|nr:proline racemase family protein [Deltaproteobacteria bacterium]
MRVIDSHTEGEPTRVIVEGGPDLGTGTLEERRWKFEREFDHVRRGTILEPRGSDALVGALLCPPTDNRFSAAAIFFNNDGYLGMCGHATIGVAVTLAHLERVGLGQIAIETPVGGVSVELTDPNQATVENVPSFCYRRDVVLDVEDLGEVTGSIAWGGNWFFLVDEAPCEIVRDNEAELTRAAIKIRAELEARAILGRDGQPIDHIEFFQPAHSVDADSRNFVLCPGSVYDRSPCGTGTSAKLACLAERGELAPGQTWIQESMIGSRFVTSYRLNEAGEIITRVTGRAYVCGDAELHFHPDDPFANGIS